MALPLSRRLDLFFVKNHGVDRKLILGFTCSLEIRLVFSMVKKWIPDKCSALSVMTLG